MNVNFCPAHARGLGICMGGAGGVEVAVERIVEPAQDAIGVGDGSQGFDLVRADDFGLKPHEAVLGALGLEHVEPFGRVGQRHAADMV